MEKFTVSYFIEKFEKIPESLWTVGIFRAEGGRACAYGHCGRDGAKGQEGHALATLMDDNNGVVSGINDGDSPKYQQPTPKQRILAALRDIKSMQNSEQGAQVSDTTKVEKSVEAGKQKEKIRYVKVEIEEMEFVEN